MNKQVSCQPETAPSAFLECERRRVFLLMMFVGGYFGAFTYSIRGGVFCNAQTGNFVLLAMALGDGEWRHALYYLVPITAYCLGAIVSEILPTPLKRVHLVRWDTLLVLVEMGAVVFMGFLPESAPVQITQILVNFICSMQYNTFRQAEGIPMATTFCTNHIRQVGVSLSKSLSGPRQERASHLQRLGRHGGMLAVFVAGGIVSTFLCRRLLGRAIWFSLIPLGIVLADLLYADLVKERECLEQTPRGH